MYSLGTALNSALRSLEANQFALEIASNNISNAQTPGYSRQRAVFAPGAADATGVGMGVEVVGTEAIRDSLIDARLRQEFSSKAQEETKHQGLSDIEMLFNDSGSTGMLSTLSDFFNSFHALSSDPTSISARQEVISKATRLVSYLNSRAQSLSGIQTRVDRAISGDLNSANTLIDQIGAISRRISQAEVTQPAYELRDQRSVLVQQLSEIVDVHEMESGGEYQLTVGGNRPLVYNGTVQHLSSSIDSNGFTAINFGLDDITGEISGGRIGANLELRDSVIPGYIGSLDQIAYEIVQNVNAIHSSAYDLDGNTGNNFFSPLASATGAAGNIALDAALTADPRRVAASRLASGSGNEAAMDLGNLLTAPVFSGGSIVDQYSSFVYTLGSDTSNADMGAREHEALLNQLQNRRQEVSGVSIDEEAVRIMQFQRSFEASARVVKTVDELLQVVLGIGQ